MRNLLPVLFLALLLPLDQQAQDSPFTEPLSEVASLLPAIPDSLRWELTFNDEFEGPVLNTKKWRLYGDPEPVPRRDGWWWADAAGLDGQGNLVMRTWQDDSTGRYYDACLHTEGVFEQAFGYFEARVALHDSEGHWPAFWLYSGDVFRIGRGGTDGAEIDIFEKFQTNRKVWHNLHWDGYEEFHQTAGKKSRHRGIMDGFHTFGLWWTPDDYRFYVNGKQVWETNAGGVCQVPLHILISDEVGEKRRMRSIEKADLPDAWRVDYVRVFRLTPGRGQKTEDRGQTGGE